MSIEILKGGLLTTLQDLGRYGHQRLGVIVGGAMDEWSHRTANALVGNLEDEATLEITLLGPSLRFTRTTLIAMTGADLSAHAGGHRLPRYCAVVIRAGAQLDFGGRVEGMRAYLAAAGGFSVPPVLGSRSTYIRGGFGGFGGRALQAGDVIPLGRCPRVLPPLPTRADARPFIVVAPATRPDTSTESAATQLPVPVRILAGPQFPQLSADSQAAFLAGPYRLDPQSDRMGCRFDGPTLAPRLPEMLSEGVAFGTVQLPPDGRPIVLMADRQTIGGYPKIGCVASVDLPVLAQLAPRAAVEFRMIGLHAAQTLYCARELELNALRRQVQGTGVGTWPVEST